MKKSLLLAGLLLTLSVSAFAQKPATPEGLTFKSKYDGYTFQLGKDVTRTKVTFHNIYGIKLVGDLYAPVNAKSKMPAIAISGPFGAVKEQSSGLYAEELARRGFITLAFDPAFTGESGGNVRFAASPDMNTEDFSAAFDFLSVQKNIDPEKIGILGICGWGGTAINAAALDTRIKATVTASLNDMSRFRAKGLFDKTNSPEARYEIKKKLNAQRTEDYRTGKYKRMGGNPNVLPENAPQFAKDYWDYYKTSRGYSERSLNSNGGFNMTHQLAFMNMPILEYSDEIQSAVLVIHGDKAHSLYFSEDAFKNLKGDNKEFLIIPGAVHCDLYDNKKVIPFAKIVDFYKANMK